MTFVYVVIHRESRTWYVGYTRQKVSTRWKRHRHDARTGCQYRFHRALRKHGADAFDWIEYGVYPSIFEGQNAEAALVSFCKLHGIAVYNSTDGGQGTTGWSHSEETRHRLREANTGANNPQYGKTLSEEHRRMVAASTRVNCPRGDDHYMTGRKHTQETLLKMSQSLLGKGVGRKPSEEARAKMRQKALVREARKRELSL
jgi:group I intron endonuclease